MKQLNVALLAVAIALIGANVLLNWENTREFGWSEWLILVGLLLAIVALMPFFVRRLLNARTPEGPPLIRRSPRLFRVLPRVPRANRLFHFASLSRL